MLKMSHRSLRWEYGELHIEIPWNIQRWYDHELPNWTQELKQIFTDKFQDVSLNQASKHM